MKGIDFGYMKGLICCCIGAALGMILTGSWVITIILGFTFGYIADSLKETILNI